MSKTETARELIDYWDRLNNRSDSDAKVGELARRVERVLAEVQRLRDLVGGDPQIPASQIVRMLDGAGMSGHTPGSWFRVESRS